MDGKFELIVSQPVVEEVDRTLRILGVNEADIQKLLEQLGALATWVTPTETITACRDPDDNKFLEAAVAGGADYIVSDDKDLRVLSPFRGIKIVTV